MLLWLDEVARRFHGWSFDPDDIDWLHLSSGWMLDFVQRIATDEDVDPDDPQIDHPLLRHVYARRGALADIHELNAVENQLWPILRPDIGAVPFQWTGEH